MLAEKMDERKIKEAILVVKTSRHVTQQALSERAAGFCSIPQDADSI